MESDAARVGSRMESKRTHEAADELFSRHSSFHTSAPPAYAATRTRDARKTIEKIDGSADIYGMRAYLL